MTKGLKWQILILLALFSLEAYSATTFSATHPRGIPSPYTVFNFQTKSTMDSYNRQLENICKLLLIREKNINRAIQHSLPEKPHPTKLPENVYYGSANDLWSRYTTARLDNLIRKRAVEIYNFVLNSSSYTPLFNSFEQLHNKMFDRLVGISEDCQVKFTTQQNGTQSIKLHEVLASLPDLSLDPMHCPEYRWGIYSPDCDRKQDSKDWHQAQRRLRYLTWQPKNFGGFTADDLFYTTFVGHRPLPENPPKTNLYRLLKSKTLKAKF